LKMMNATGVRILDDNLLIQHPGWL
jgi:hypothetical protein